MNDFAKRDKDQTGPGTGPAARDAASAFPGGCPPRMPYAAPNLADFGPLSRMTGGGAKAVSNDGLGPEMIKMIG